MHPPRHRRPTRVAARGRCVSGVSAALALTAALGVQRPGAAGPDGERFPGVAAALNLNLDAPPNYTNPAWLAMNDDADARTLDNTPFANLGTDRGATLGRGRLP